jgi:hypothetical protein
MDMGNGVQELTQLGGYDVDGRASPCMSKMTRWERKQKENED